MSFVIQYRSDISEKWNIKFRGQKYNIQFIDNVKYGDQYLEIKATLAG